MSAFIYVITALFQISVFILTLYYFVISIFGLYKSENGNENVPPEKSFALIVAAHNEELVIAQAVESLKSIDYPSNLFDVFVIADNCTDSTAEIAERCGANVYRRVDNDKRGKGFALEWMFSRIFEMNRKYDAVIVFDADNLASKNFLREMNRKLLQGYKVIQGYLDSKNPHDSWISEAYSIAFWTSNRLYQLSRSNLGLSNQIGGTGFCVETETLKRLGWGATCLTEDLEFTCKLVLNGLKVGWAHDAVIYDEKPLTLSQSWRQRKRWMQGYADVASRFFLQLIKKSIKEGDLLALDCAFYTIQPFVVIGLGISVILSFMQNMNARGMNIFVINSVLPAPVWYFFSIFQFLFTPFVMMLEKKLGRKMFGYFTLYSTKIIIFNSMFDSTSELHMIVSAHILFFAGFIFILATLEGRHSLKVFICYLLYGIYTLTWIPIAVQGIINKDKKEWNHTKHTRQISINEIEDLGGRSAA